MKILYGACMIILLCMTASCIKDPFKIQIFGPNPGKFECYINGQDFVPDQGVPNLMGEGGPVMVYFKKLDDGAYDVDIATRITSSNGSPARDLDLHLHEVLGAGTFKFNDLQNQYAQYGIYPLEGYNSQPNNIIYQDHSAGNGQVVISNFDAGKSVISGTFSFKAINVQNPTDSVIVTNGHFNINYANQ